MNENKYKKLALNTVIFAVGNFGSKILSFLIVPLYTYVLTTEEYGMIDLFITSLGLMIPFSTMMVNEALIRFTLGKEMTPSEAASNCLVIFCFGAIGSILLTPIYKRIFKFDGYMWMFVALLVIQTFNRIYSEYFKAIDQNVKYTILGLVSTVCTLGFNLLFLLYFKLGIRGYLYATLLSAVVSSIYILIFSDFFKTVSLRNIDRKVLTKILKYSIPLVPNSLMWWIMSAGDKYIINYFLGDASNGIYSLALKIPQIINMVYALFIQAWQMSAIEVNLSENKGEFYQKVFSVTSFAMAFIATGIVMLVKPVYSNVMNKNFIVAWKYVPLLSAATVISCYSSFFGVVYTVGTKTKKAFLTTALGAAVNLICNFILVGPFGIQGIAVGTCLGYAVVLAVRVNDMKKEMGISVDLRLNFVVFILLLLQYYTLIMYGEMAVLVLGSISLMFIFYMYRTEINVIYKKFLHKK